LGRIRLAIVLSAVFVACVTGGAVRASPADDLRVPDGVRSVSYFPARSGWTLMWTRFDVDAIDRDLARIAWLHANTVRVIVPPRVFGYPEPQAAMSARLEQVVGLAARRGLRVELTLFDWWHEYADIAGSRRWAAAVLSPYAGDARIAFVELKNEIRPQDTGAADWAAALIPYVREVARRPVTISVPALDPARDLRVLRAALASAQPDFYSAHFYWRPELAAEHLEAARAAVAPLPLRLGETGYSTAIPYDVLPGVPASPSAREAQQAYYLRSLALVARRLGLPPIAPWILSDFAPDAIPADDPGVYRNAREYRFGLFRVSGTAKPAAAELRTIFSTGPGNGFNGGFEDAVRDEGGRTVPALWRIRRASNAAFTRDARVARTGVASARIDGAGVGTGPDAAYAIAPPDPAVREGDRSTVTAFARASPRCREVRLALRWFSAEARAVGGAQSGRLPCGTRGWRPLRASGVAPSGAAYVGIYLRAAGTVGPAWFDDVSYSYHRVRLNSRRADGISRAARRRSSAGPGLAR
jgi:Cellulase (glycosyl hydrolase family 5)